MFHSILGSFFYALLALSSLDNPVGAVFDFTA